MRFAVAGMVLGMVASSGCTLQPGADGATDAQTLVIFHNGSGPMCLAALDWLDGAEVDYPALVVEEHLTYEAGEITHLRELQAEFVTSEGVSSSFEYLPIMFLEDRAFSGFDDAVAEALGELLSP